jgi:hypothetical protein
LHLRRAIARVAVTGSTSSNRVLNCGCSTSGHHTSEPRLQPEPLTQRQEVYGIAFRATFCLCQMARPHCIGGKNTSSNRRSQGASIPIRTPNGVFTSLYWLHPPQGFVRPGPRDKAETPMSHPNPLVAVAVCIFPPDRPGGDVSCSQHGRHGFRCDSPAPFFPTILQRLWRPANGTSSAAAMR